MLRRPVLPTLFLFFFLFLKPAGVYAVLGCQGIAISNGAGTFNGMNIYHGGETVSVSVTGSPDSTGMTVYWKSAYLPMNDSSGFNQITGTYNPNNKTFNGSFTLPYASEEIFLMANATGPNGQWCSGNPCSSACPGGAVWQSGGSAVCGPSPVSCCTGCQRKIVVDPLYGLNSSTAVDLKNYYNFNPGNYWEFSGLNYTYSPAKPFTSRFEVEAPVLMCNHRAGAVIRYLKDEPWGYISPLDSWSNPNSRWVGNIGYRIAGFYFDNDSKWNNGFFGTPWFDSYYLLNSPDQLKGLGAMGTGFLPFVYNTSGSQHFYFAPYLYGPRYAVDSPGWTWQFDRWDNTNDFDPTITNDACKFETQAPWKDDYDSNRDHGWRVMLAWENISVPLYQGKALRIIYLEYGLTGNPPSLSNPLNFLLREDWYYAPGIGLVLHRQKNIYAQDRDKFSFNWSQCGADCTNTPMTNPETEMKLAKKYLGDTLNVSSPVSWVKPGTGSTWPLNFSENYTGYIDANVSLVLANGNTQNTFTGYWQGVWVQNGTVNAPVPDSVVRGNYSYRFRRHMPDVAPNQYPKGETPDPSFTNSLPWSNPVTVSFTDTAPCDPNSWGSWSACTKSCGGGTQTRTNACGTTQTQSCDTQACCDPNIWGNWGSCSKTCGGGVETRTNQCGSSQTQTCNSQKCPVPGDLNNDFAVNILDLRKAVSRIFSAFSLFDYNTVIANFGK